MVDTIRTRRDVSPQGGMSGMVMLWLKYIIVLFLIMPSVGWAACSNTTNGTPQSLTALTQSGLQNGQAAGSITPGCMRDIVASTYGSANNNVNLKNLGLPTGGDDTAAINAALASILPASFTGTASILPAVTLPTSSSTASGATLPFTSTAGVAIGVAATGANIPPGAYVLSFVANTSVTLSASITGTVGSAAPIMFAPSLVVTGSPGGSVAVGQSISGAGSGVPAGETIIPGGSGAGAAGVYSLNTSTTAASQTITFQPPATAAVYAPAATYKHAGVITVNGVSLYGDGASTVFQATDATNPNPQTSIRLTGTNPSVKNIKTTTTWNGTRQANNESAAILLDGTGVSGFTVAGNIIVGSPSAGILNFGGSNGVIENNKISATLADAVHNTNTAHDVLVSGNYASNVGDDCYPVVSYTRDSGPTTRIHVIGNSCYNTAYNGLRVSGGIDNEFIGNIVDTTAAYCIYANSDNVADSIQVVSRALFQGNSCRNMGAGAMIDGRSGFVTSGVTLEANTFFNISNFCMGFGINQNYNTGTVLRGNTCVAASGNTGEGIYIQGATTPSIINNNIVGFKTGILNNTASPADSGTILISGNTFDGLNPGAAGGVYAIALFNETFSTAIIRDNIQINDGTTIAGLVLSNTIPTVIIDGNAGDNVVANNVSGVTKGHMFDSNGVGYNYNSPLVHGGTKFTASGCTNSATVGSGTAGRLTLGAVSCSVVVTLNGATGMTAPNGWACAPQDQTHPTALIVQSASTATTATIAVPGTPAAISDVIAFACQPY